MGGSSARLCRGALLSAQLRAGEARGIHDRFATGRHGRKASLARGLRGAFAAAAMGGGGAKRLPAFAPRAAGYGGRPPHILHFHGSRVITPSFASRVLWPLTTCRR